MPSAEAHALIHAFKSSKTHYHGVNGGFFGRELIEQLLAIPGCDGIRYYHALGPDKHDNNKIKHTIILAPEDSKGKPIGKEMLDDGPACPPYCPG